MHVFSPLPLPAGEVESGSAGGAYIQLLMFILIPVGMYFLLIRPQRRRQREQVALQAAIGVGDEVITTAGLYGFVTGLEGDIVWLEIDDNIQVRMARAAIARRVDTADPAPPAEAVEETGKTDVDAILGDDESK
jgi:preprotein translocase subunit YajC